MNEPLNAEARLRQIEREVAGLRAQLRDQVRRKRETRRVLMDRSLDVAWAEAERSLPIGIRIESVSRWDSTVGSWRAYAQAAPGFEADHEAKRFRNDPGSFEGFGDTPVNALRALADAASAWEISA